MNVQEKLKEPSTWAGIGLLGLALDKIFDINEAATIGADIVSTASNGGSVASIITVAVGSLLSIFLREGNK
jgi:hypothetical protein